MKIDQNTIKTLIPHRDPFLFVDEVEIIKTGISGVGYKKFHESEYFFKGHFPNKPIVPGVILIEALAQTAGVVVSQTFDNNNDRAVLFMSVSKAKFRKPVLPNDFISLNVDCINKVRSVYKFRGEAFESKNKVCEAEFSAMIGS